MVSIVSDRYGVIALRCLLVSGCLLVTATSPWAAESEAALKQRLRVLETRIEFLESKLTSLEKAAAQEASEKAKSRDKQSKPGNGQAVLTRTQNTAGSSVVGAVNQAPTTEQENPASTGNQPSRRRAAQTAKETSVPQETFIFRDQAPTLKQGKIEVSEDFNYLRASGFLQTDRVVVATSTARVGVTDRLEMALSVPVYYSLRTTSLLPGQDYNDNERGIGAATAAASYSLFSETPEYPGVAISAAAIYPGTISPYNFNPLTYKTGQNPIDILKSVPSAGHWGIGGNVVAYKIVDPLVVYVGVGAQYYFPRVFSGIEIEPATRYLFNAGVNFALSDKATLGFDFRSFVSPDFKVQGVMVPSSLQEQYIGRIVLTQRMFEETWVETSLGLGLTKDSPDLNIGVSIRKRN